MDESLQEFEGELKALAPRPLSPRLIDRIADNLAGPSPEAPGAQNTVARFMPRFIAQRWLEAAAMGLAAVLAIGALVFFSPKNRPSAGVPAERPAAVGSFYPVPAAEKNSNVADTYHPVAAANVLYEMKDEGPVTKEEANSDRRIRYRYVATYTWKNPRTNASLTWSVPRDEVRVQPARFN